MLLLFLLSILIAKMNLYYNKKTRQFYIVNQLNSQLKL